MTESGWRRQVVQQLKERNRVESDFFKQVIESHVALWKQNRALELQNRQLDQQLVIARYESSTGDGSTKSARQVQALEKKIEQLKDELSNKYKKEASSATSQLQLSSEVRTLQKECDAIKIVLNEKQTELETKSKQVEDLEKVLKSKEDSIEILRKEVLHLRAMFERSEETVLQLRNENLALTQRMVDEKMQLMEEMNRMTELNAEMQRRIKELQAGSGKAPANASENDESSEHQGVPWFNNPIVQMPEKPLYVIKAHETEIPSVCFNGDGSELATGSSDGTVCIWSRSGGNALATMRSNRGSDYSPSPIMCVSMKKDFVLGASCDRTCRVWSRKTERLLHQFTGHSGKVLCAEFTPSSNVVITGSTDRKLRVWDMNTGNKLRQLSASSSCNSLDINGDGTIMATGHQDNRVRLWDLRQWSAIKILETHAAAVTSTSFSLDGRTLVTNSLDNSIAIIETFTMTHKKKLTHSEYRVPFLWSRSCFDPGGNLVAAGSKDGALYVWNVLTDGCTILRSHTSPVACTAWSPNGDQVATCDQSGNLILWSCVPTQ